MEFVLWKEKVRQAYWKLGPATGQREGQFYMNHLYKDHHDAYARIIGTKLTPGVDPFYDNSKLPDFFAELSRIW